MRLGDMRLGGHEAGGMLRLGDAEARGDAEAGGTRRLGGMWRPGGH